MVVKAIKLFRKYQGGWERPPDNTVVDLYSSRPAADGQRYKKLPCAQSPRPSISLIATVKNEGRAIEGWFLSLLDQTCPPNEIIIIDGGSIDNTYRLLKKMALKSPVPTRIIQCPGVNIAAGRNQAIRLANGPLISCTDAGCEIPCGWLASITGPFAADPAIEVVAGYYEAIQETHFQSALAPFLVPPPPQGEMQSFLPSARSVAFRKEAWESVRGFPEWLTFAGEDTVFGLALKNKTRKWAFVPEAVVRWRLQPTVGKLFRQVRQYGRGSGEAGVFPEEYFFQSFMLLSTVCFGLLIGFLGLLLAYMTGHWLWLLPALSAGLWAGRRVFRSSPRTPSANGLASARTVLLSILILLTIRTATLV
ncbi:MAG TPA: glycosyltransferase, partial [Acidobacteriota bacterium]|nr:glycosyltransferase [Acidobacteriota bacterium]